MCGKEDDAVGGELYQGTAKSVEGHAADIALKKAKEEGMHIEIQWQDGDSSAAESFHDHFQDEAASKVMLCAGHVSRAFTKSLGELAKQKLFSPALRDIHRKKFSCCRYCQMLLPKEASKKLWMSF